MASNVSLKELQAAVQRSGLPMGNAGMMNQALPTARDPISSMVYGGDTQLPQYQDARMKQLSMIAEMDKKLAGVYSDPSSQLFIEHPLQREKLLSGAANTGYKAAGDLASGYKQRKAELDAQISETLSLYKQLVNEQERVEREAEKARKESERQAKKTGKQVRSSQATTKSTKSGNTITSTTSTQPTQSSGYSFTKGEQRDLERAGIRDDAAALEYLNKPPAFRRWFTDKQQDNQLPRTGAISKEEIEREFKQYEKQTGKKKRGSGKSTNLY